MIKVRVLFNYVVTVGIYVPSTKTGVCNGLVEIPKYCETTDNN